MGEERDGIVILYSEGMDPYEYGKGIDAVIRNTKAFHKEALRDEEKRYEEKRKSLIRENEHKVDDLERQIKSSSNLLRNAFTVSVVVFAILFIVSIATFFRTDEATIQFVQLFGITLTSSQCTWLALWVWFGVPGLSFFVALAVFDRIEVIQAENLHTQLNRIKKESANDLDRLQKEYAETINEMETSTSSVVATLESERVERKTLYDEERIRESARFADSITAQKVASEILDAFKNLIEKADRRPHIEYVEVSCCFKVSRTEIEMPTRTYSFMLERVVGPEKKEEQAAFAFAVAQKIELGVKRAYSRDVSGGKVKSVATELFYGRDNVRAFITYKAFNAGFVPERSL